MTCHFLGLDFKTKNDIPHVSSAMIPLLAVIYQMSLSVKSLNLMLTVDSEIPPIDRNHMAKCLYKKATFSMCILSEVSKLF